MTPGWKGCALSQIKIVEEARVRGELYVLQWEDDCTPRNRHPLAIRAMWDEILPKLAANMDKWDVVLGATSRAYKGSVLNKQLSTHNVKVHDLPQGFCAHWALWNVASTYDKLMKYKETLHEEIDIFMYKEFRVKVVLPFLAEQHASYSDIENMNADYRWMFDTTEKDLYTKVSSLSDIIHFGKRAGFQTPKFMDR
jgi:hypothetical protein